MRRGAKETVLLPRGASLDFGRKKEKRQEGCRARNRFLFKLYCTKGITEVKEKFCDGARQDRGNAAAGRGPGLKPNDERPRVPRRPRAPPPCPFEAQGKLKVRGFYRCFLP